MASRVRGKRFKAQEIPGPLQHQSTLRQRRGHAPNVRRKCGSRTAAPGNVCFLSHLSESACAAVARCERRLTPAASGRPWRLCSSRFRKLGDGGPAALLKSSISHAFGGRPSSAAAFGSDDGPPRHRRSGRRGRRPVISRINPRKGGFRGGTARKPECIDSPLICEIA